MLIGWRSIRFWTVPVTEVATVVPSIWSVGPEPQPRRTGVDDAGGIPVWPPSAGTPTELSPTGNATGDGSDSPRRGEAGRDVTCPFRDAGEVDGERVGGDRGEGDESSVFRDRSLTCPRRARDDHLRRPARLRGEPQ